MGTFRCRLEPADASGRHPWGVVFSIARGLSVLGLTGGALICITGLGVVLDVFARGGTAQAIATVPEFLWELSLGIYPIVKGFKASPILEAAPPTSQVSAADSSPPGPAG